MIKKNPAALEQGVKRQSSVLELTSSIPLNRRFSSPQFIASVYTQAKQQVPIFKNKKKMNFKFQKISKLCRS